MRVFWDWPIEPIIRSMRPRVMVEIGVANGATTRELLSYCRANDAVLHAVDPAPDVPIEDLEEAGGSHLIFHREISLAVLPSVEGAELVLIDGDHNWHTVYHELCVLLESAERTGSSFPLCLLHDIGWPYGRRDMYYEPDTIPEAERNPAARAGLVEGQIELASGGGFNFHLWNALHEGGPKNGVLTAIEDFLSERGGDLRFVAIPGFHGLGCLGPRELFQGDPTLRQLLEDAARGKVPAAFAEMLESARLKLLTDAWEERRRLRATKAIKEKLEQESHSRERSTDGFLGSAVQLEESVVRPLSRIWTDRFSELETVVHDVSRTSAEALHELLDSAGEIKELLSRAQVSNRIFEKELERSELFRRERDLARRTTEEREAQLEREREVVKSLKHDIELEHHRSEGLRAELEALQTKESTLGERIAGQDRDLGVVRRELAESQRELREVRDYVMNLEQVIEKARRHSEELFASRRWRTGNFIGDLALGARGRRRPPTAEDHLRKLYRKAEKYRRENRTTRRQQKDQPPEIRQVDLAARVGGTLYGEVLGDLMSDCPDELPNALVEAADTVRKLHDESGPRKSSPLVSVIMPTYNRQELVGDAIRTVVEQQYHNWELLVCDDGSTDETERCVLGFDDDRITHLKLPHCGAAAARNSGLEQASGELIAYLDSDNLWSPDYLSVMVAALAANHGYWSAYADYIDCRVDDGGELKVWKISRRPFDYRKLEEKNFVDLNSFVHRREALEVFGAFDPDLPRQQDWELILRYTFLRDPMHVKAPLTIYRRNRKWNQITDLQRHNPRSQEIIRRRKRERYLDGMPAVISGRRPSVTILSWDACRNHFSKAYNLAEALSVEREVQLLSFRFFDEPIFPPYRDAKPEFEMEIVDGTRLPSFLDQLAEMALRAKGDVLYAVKPRLPSLGVALMANFHFGRPFVMETNDYESTVAKPSREQPVDSQPTDVLHGEGSTTPYSDGWTRIMEDLGKQLPWIATHNRNLEQAYGGGCFQVRNLKDERWFDPERIDRNAVRLSMGIAPEERVILFGGMPRRHKAIGELVDYVETESRIPNLRLMFVSSRETPDQRLLRERATTRVEFLPPRDRNEMAEVTAAADAVVIWLDPAVSASHYQMPYKLTDALAMKVPVIANPISDLEEFGEAGYLRLVEFGDYGALDQALIQVFEDRDTTDEMLCQGRELYLRQFSYASIRRTFDVMIKRVSGERACYEASIRFMELLASVRNRQQTELPRDPGA
jgi:glycosyltransferase involved in cell wall biosynthesis